MRARLIAGLIASIGALLATDAPAQVIVFDTSQSPFLSGWNNSGWWSETQIPTSDNYFTGNSSVYGVPHEHRSYFTFDLATLTEVALSATLEVARYDYVSSAPYETIGLFEVSTSPADLHVHKQTSASIFLDLGSGRSYGTSVVSSGGQPNDVLSFPLNADAVSDINAAHGGFFSIGGALLTLDGTIGDSGSEAIFSSSGGGGPQRLILQVPEPATITLLAFGGLALIRRRRM